jgi:hypothetical protein
MFAQKTKKPKSTPVEGKKRTIADNYKKLKEFERRLKRIEERMGF